MEEKSQSYGLKLLPFDDPDGGVLAYAMDTGRITGQDAAPLWSRFDAAKADGKRLSVYCQLDGVPSVSAEVIGDKFRRFGTLYSAVRRIAIVGDQAWLDLYSRVVDPITRFDLRHFPSTEAAAARAWVEEQDPTT